MTVTERVWRHLVKRMYDECGSAKAEDFIRRVESGERDVPSPWAIAPYDRGDEKLCECGHEKHLHWPHSVASCVQRRERSA